jgi:sirohydrochlorin ferrochelatase
MENPGAEAKDPSVGFLVLAPDRGFLGNEEIRDAFAELSVERNAALVFVTDERTRAPLQGALTRLREAGAKRVVALPFFLTESHPRWTLALRLLEELAPPDVQTTRSFGATYLGVEVLADHFRRITDPAGRHVVVMGYGASDEETRRRMSEELRVSAQAAAAGFGFEEVRVVVWHELGNTNDSLAQASRAALQDAVGSGERALVVPFHLGRKLDGMMTFNAALRRDPPENAELLDADVTPHPAVALWMRREANRTTLSADDIGVVVLAHGSDFNWNETMRVALQPLVERHAIEVAFCMADQPIVERAVQRLESHGARGIVVVRVFGMESSFRGAVERMVGMDVEQAAGDVPTGEHAHHGHGHGHGEGETSTAPPPRIRSAAVITTLGGLEDHALFAEALVARARELSDDPARETVILVAHGLGDDAQNDHWVGVLESLADRMRSNGGGGYRDIQVGTWREDWPDKRDLWVARIREFVKAASEDGGKAIVIPARTNATGPERELLDGLDYRLGEGFAPHPLFARWVEEQIRLGEDRLLGGERAEAHPDHPGDHAQGHGRAAND